MKKYTYQSLAACRIATLVLLNIGLCAVFAQAGTYTASYLGGGVWEQDGNWSTNAYPQNGHYVIINGNPYPDGSPLYNVAIDIATPCTLGTFVNVQTVNVANGSTLNLAPTSYLNLWTNAGLGNAGLITLNATSSGGGMRLGADSNVVNGGEILMNDSPFNVVTSGDAGKVFTVFAGGTIHGAGSLNAYLGDDRRVYMQWVNHGLIEAMQPVNPLTINLTDQAGINGLINDATLRARGQALLRITAIFTANNSGNVLNEGGTIEAIDNGTVRFASGVTVKGGTLSTSGNGSIHGDYPGNGGGTLNNVTNTGLVAIADNEGLGLDGTFTNNGQVTLDSTGSGASLFIRGDVTVDGNGSITLGNQFNNQIAGGDSNGFTLTLAAGAVIRGGGTFSTNNANFAAKTLNVVNQGLIESTAAMTMFLNDSANSNLTNSGTLRATNGSTLSLTAAGTGTVTNTDGVIAALNTSTVRVGNAVTVEGGTTASSGSGAIRGGTSGAGGGTLSNVTNTGLVALGDGEALGLKGLFANNGQLTLDSTGGGTSLFVRGNVTLAGNGSIALGSQFSNGIAGGDANGFTLTVAPGATIRGGGHISTNNANFGDKFLNVVNQGLIESTSGMTIFVYNGTDNNVTNSGILRASASGGYLQLWGGGTVNNTGGVLEALAGSSLQFDAGATVTNYNSSTQTLTGGAYLANNGTLNLNIGAVGTNAATVVLAGPSSVFTPINSIHQNDGTFVITNGRTLGVTPPQAESLATTSANVFPNTGTLILGPNDSSFSITGDYAQGSGSVLEIVIGADYPNPSFHHMNVSGSANLAGTLEIKLANGYVPAPNQTFEIIHANGGINGGFVTVNGAIVTYTSTGVFIHPTGNTNALQLTKTVSRKTHGTAGSLDINLPLTGAPGVECRSSGGNHTLVFTFSNNLVSGNAIRTSGVGAVLGSPTFAGKTMTVNLTGVADAQVVTLTLRGLTDVFSQVLPDQTFNMGVLLGDTTGNGTVTSSDVSQTKLGAGATVTEANARQDVTVNGAITSSDLSLVKLHTGAAIP